MPHQPGKSDRRGGPGFQDKRFGHDKYAVTLFCIFVCFFAGRISPVYFAVFSCVSNIYIYIYNVCFGSVCPVSNGTMLRKIIYYDKSQRFLFLRHGVQLCIHVGG